MIAVLGAAGTIGRTVTGFLESWGAPFKRLDFRLDGDEHVDVTDRASLRAGLEGVNVVVNSVDYRFNLDDAPLEAFVDRVLGPAARNRWLLDSLAGLLDAGCRWSEAAERLGVHRHTLRYRMDRLREATGRHPDDPEQRMELWLALKAHDALDARRGTATT